MQSLQVACLVFLKLHGALFFPQKQMGQKLMMMMIPERTTRSMTERLLLAKACLRVVKLENGVGMLARASDARDRVPSLLPVSTSHIDLLNCTRATVKSSEKKK